MLKTLTRVICGSFLMLLVMSPAQALPALDGNGITSFLATLGPLRKLGEKYQDDDFDKAMSARNMAAAKSGKPLSAAVAELPKHKGYPEFMAVIRGQGFSSAESWAAIGDRIITAYVTHQMTAEHPDSKQDMAQAMASMNNNPNLTPEQAAAIQQMMQSSMGMMKAYTNAPKEDVAAIMPYLPQIKATFEEEGNN